MRLARLVPAFLLLALSSCARREDPPWAKMPASGVEGEATIKGEPAAIGRFSQPPALDGKLDDAVWASAPVLGPFVGPGDGRDSRGHEVAGFAKLGWDDAKLYVGAVVFDRSASSPFSRDDVDPHLWEKSSALELMVQPGDPGDNKGYFEIQVDVHGAVFDTAWDDYNVPQSDGPTGHQFGHQDWSCKAERAVYVSEGRFYALEIAIPWSAFERTRFASPPRPGDTWRLNLYSFRDGQSLALAWSPIRGQGNFHKSARFGRIRFQ
jgi:hypothetical protein